MREEADLLDHVADPAAKLGEVERADAPAVDRDVALGDRDQAVHHLHRRRLAAARRPDEHADLAGGIVSESSLTAGAADPDSARGPVEDDSAAESVALRATGRYTVDTALR